jgi:predicted PurR-regulated permease PerM
MTPALGTFVLVVLVVSCLYFARPVLIPVAVATLLTFMLGPAVAFLHRRGLPRTPAVLLVVAFSTVVLVSALWMVGSQVVQLLADLPAYQENVAKRVTEVRQGGSGELLRNVRRFVHEIATAATGPPATPHESANDEAITVRVVEQAGSSVATWLRGLQPVAEPFLLAAGVFVLLVYLLIFRDDLRSRILVLMGRGNLTLTTKALDDAGRRISRYLLAQFALNFGFGCCIFLGLLVLGVPHAALWGFAAGLLRYIPYLGPWMAATLPVGMSLLVSEGWMQPLGVLALFAVCEFSSNLVIEPWVYGQSIGVSQAAIIVSVIFWTWLWGPLGMVLAAPLTVCLVVIGKYVPALSFFDVLLGDEPVLTPDMSLYQRVLAGDVDEAAEMVRGQSEKMTPIEVCDRLLLPAVVHARRDLAAGQLSGEEYERVLDGVRLLAEQQDLAAAANAERDSEGDRDEVLERPALTVLACPAQDGADALALALFQQVLDGAKFQVEVVSPKHLVSEVMELVEARRPAVVCITSLPTGGLAQTRHLCKRLRGRFGGQKILVGRWGTHEPIEDREQWKSCGADYVGATLAETMSHLEQIGQFLRPAPGEGSPGAPHFASLISAKS